MMTSLQNHPIVSEREADVKVEEIEDDSHSELSEDEQHDHEGDCSSHEHAVHHNRNEKKARKVISKLGLKCIPGITRVTICRSKNVIFVIHRPEVYKNPISNTFIVFGEAKIEDMGMAAQAQAARRLREEESISKHLIDSSIGTPTESSSFEQQDEQDNNEPLDESGLEEKDIEMVMSQCSVSRRKAVKSLRDNQGDIVNAIMALSE